MQLRSILEQTFSDFELILVDDGSPDNCGAICDEYARKDSRIHVIHQENGGLSAARNTGIEWVFANSGSEWLTFIDSDDWVHKEYLSVLYNAASMGNCTLSACGIFRTSDMEMPVFSEEATDCVEADDFYCGDIPGILPMVAVAKLYRRELFLNLRYPVGKLHEDEFTTYRAVYDAKNIAVSKALLYAYFQNPEGIMRSRWNPQKMEGIRAMEEQMAFAQKMNKTRLLEQASLTRCWLVLQQLREVRDLTEMDETARRCREELQEHLRIILKDKRNRKRYPFIVENIWIYEEAYPRFPLWKIMHAVYGAVKLLMNR